MEVQLRGVLDFGLLDLHSPKNGLMDLNEPVEITVPCIRSTPYMLTGLYVRVLTSGELGVPSETTVPGAYTVYIIRKLDGVYLVVCETIQLRIDYPQKRYRKIRRHHVAKTFEVEYSKICSIIIFL